MSNCPSSSVEAGFASSSCQIDLRKTDVGLENSQEYCHMKQDHRRGKSMIYVSVAAQPNAHARRNCDCPRRSRVALRLMAVLPCGHELAGREIVALSDLLAFPLLSCNEECPPGLLWQLRIVVRNASIALPSRARPAPCRAM